MTENANHFQVGTESFEINHYRSPDETLTSDLIRDFTKAFRMVFANQPYGQFLYYPSEGTPISAQEAFETSEFVDEETLNSFDHSAFPRHSDTDEEAIFWVEPNRTFEVFSEKLKRNAFLSTLRDPESKSLIAASLGYETTLQEAFEHEEWQDDKLYSSLRNPDQCRNFDTFLKKIQEQSSEFFPEGEPIRAETRVFCMNCLFLTPQYQGRSIGYHLQKRFFENLPESVRQMPCISEMVLGTSLQKRAISDHKSALVSGILSEDHLENTGERIIIVSTAQHYYDTISDLLPQLSHS